MDHTTSPTKNSKDEELSSLGPPRTGTVEDVASYVGHRAEDAGAAVGSGLRSLGDTVRDHGPEGGMAGDASSAVADTLESSGRYLQEEGLKAITEDMTNLIRRNPIPALLIGVAAGYLVGRAMTPRS